MKGNALKVFGLYLLGYFLLLTLSCSTGDHMISRTESLDPRRPSSQEMSKFFQKVRSSAGNPDSHYLLACYDQERDRHREAIAEFKKALAIDPTYVRAYNGMGISFDHLGDFPKAVECYEKALQLSPNLDYVHNNLGYSHLLQGNLDEAIAALK